MSRPLIVAGMHRSGTSLVASLLQAGGVNLGERLVAPAADNPRGFFEDADFYEFHARALREREQTLFASRDFVFTPTAVERERAQALIHARDGQGMWGWKDPRTSLFLDFWQELLPEANFLFVYRHPLDVLLSLVRRGEPYALGLAEGLEAWQLYNSRIIEFCGRHRAHVLLCHIYSVTDRLDEFKQLLRAKFGLELELTSDALNALYHPDELKRTALGAESEMILNCIRPESLELYAQLNARADLPFAALPSSESSPDLAALCKFVAGLPLDAARRRGLLVLLLAFIAPDAVENFFHEQTDAVARTLQGRERLWAWLEQDRDHWQQLAEERATWAHTVENEAWARGAELERLRNSPPLRAARAVRQMFTRSKNKRA
jgi:hypothetical protein